MTKDPMTNVKDSSQSLNRHAGIAELIDFAQDRCKRLRQTAHSLKSLRWENFR